MHAGEGPCLATFFVTKYWQFLLLRVLTGISVGGTLPLVYSLVGDLFNAHQRATVAAGIQIATGIGLAAGQAIAGFVGEISKSPLPRLPSRKVASDLYTQTESWYLLQSSPGDIRMQFKQIHHFDLLAN